MSDQPDTHRAAPQHWVDALQQAREDVAAGRTVPAKVVHALLRKSVAALQAEVLPALEDSPARKI